MLLSILQNLGWSSSSSDAAGEELFLSYGDGFWTFQNDAFRAIKREKQREMELEQVRGHSALPYRATLNRSDGRICLILHLQEQDPSTIVIDICLHMSLLHVWPVPGSRKRFSASFLRLWHSTCQRTPLGCN